MMAITAPVALNRPQATQWLPDQTGSSGLLSVNAGQSIRGMGLFPDGPNLYGYARQAPGKNIDPTGLSMASGPMSVKPPRSLVEQCGRSDNVAHCTPLYSRCVDLHGHTALLLKGRRCYNCHDMCILNGYWPFEYCPLRPF